MECVGAIVREFVRETLLSMCIEYRYICDNMYVTMHTFMHECVRARHDEVQAITDQQPLQVVDHQDEPDQQGEMNEASLQTTALYIYTRTYAHTHTGLLHQACFSGRTRCPQSTRRTGAG